MPASRLFFDPLQHDLEGKPGVPYLAVVLTVLFACEDPGRNRPGVFQGFHLLVMHLKQDEMVLSAGQDQDVLLYEFRVQVVFVEPEQHVHSRYRRAGPRDVHQVVNTHRS